MELGGIFAKGWNDSRNEKLLARCRQPTTSLRSHPRITWGGAGQGQLFTQDFLEQGITETEQWGSLDEEVFKGFVDRLRNAYGNFAGIKDPNEATTERQLIDPVLKALGWDHFLPQQSAAKHRSDVPDYLLFEDEAALARVKRAKEPDRYKSGVAIVEGKKWQCYAAARGRSYIDGRGDRR